MTPEQEKEIREKIIREYVANISVTFHQLTDEEQEVFLHAFKEAVCIECGSKAGTYNCYCMRDD